ncbi:Ribonucleases P/MRP protein subunit POP5 [Escovopsis weberi]|uniref:Ribonuclease P/MRP protein subunit POP5 n=1 Tax=Escovopsis weberi TaxID=150374 RepID=A0A0M8N6A4_ESCWE|nr:Ribonucleases P/MRP protein subunit POP5 [Escovopsis weberi]
MVRIKERYLLVNILYPSELPASSSVPDYVAHHRPTIERLTPQALAKAIKAEVSLLYGDYGLGAVEGNLSIKYSSLATSTFIIRCSRAHYRLVWSALTFMDHVPVRDGRPCIFRVVRASGTMRKAEEEAIRQARRLILAAKGDASKAAAAASSSITAALREQDSIMVDADDDDDDDDELSQDDHGDSHDDRG